MLPPFKGDRFARWTVLEDRQYKSPVVPCRCDCGNERVIPVGNLKFGKSLSCGCLKSEVTSARAYVHGSGYEDYRYRLWRKIKAKCFTETTRDYRYYGGRGITMFEPWIKDFPAFATWLDETLGPRLEGMSLDRTDNEGNYEPGNLRWATREQQANNRRNRYRVLTR